eukprot:11205472-Lingulodinium_polyedra.AAC.1
MVALHRQRTTRASGSKGKLCAAKRGVGRCRRTESGVPAGPAGRPSIRSHSTAAASRRSRRAVQLPN